MIFLKKYYVNVTAGLDCLAVTHEVRYALQASGVQQGLVTVMVPAPGASVLVGEAHEDVLAGIRDVVSQWGKACTQTETKNQWQQEVALPPRVYTALLGRSVQLPCSEGTLCLDPYSDVLLCDFDSAAGRREIIVQVMGEGEAQAQPQQ